MDLEREGEAEAYDPAEQREVELVLAHQESRKRGHQEDPDPDEENPRAP